MHLQLQTSKNIDLTTHKRHMPDGLKLFLMILPFVIFIFALYYVPLFGWIFAFFDYKPGIPLSKTPYVGLEHFAQVVRDGGELLRVLRNTIVISFLGVLSSPLPIVFSLLLNEIGNSKYKKLVQTTTTLPNFISWIILFGLAFSILSYEGMYNNLLQILGLNRIPPPGILGNVDAVWVFQWALGTWKHLGWGAIIYLATIAGLDKELFDAAKIDGANRFQVIMNVTVPGLYSTYLVLLLLQISNMLNNGFDQFFVFFNPLVADKIEVLDYYVYKIGFLANDYPLSTAMGMSKSLISISLLFTANALSKRLRGESIV